MGQWSLFACLCLTLCAGGVMSQIAPTDNAVVQFEFYLQNMSYSAKDDLADDTSQIYAEMRAKVEEYMQPLGGTLEDLIFSNGGGCVKIFVSWRNGDDRHELMSVMDTLKRNGFMIWGETWRVSFTGCAASTDVHMLTLKFYVVNLPWMDNFKSYTSTEYQLVSRIVENYFVELGGIMQQLELAQNNGCVEFYVEWDSTNPANVLSLMSTLKASGFSYMGETFPVKTKPCLPSAAEVDECPNVPSETFGICLEECDDSNPAMKCDEGFKCCSNGCGHKCVRVGYALKVNATIALNMTYIDGMDDMQGQLFALVKSAVKMMAMDAFSSMQDPVATDVEVMMIRRKMQENQYVPLLHLVFYMSRDASNEEVHQFAEQLMKMEGTMSGRTVGVLHVMFGNSSAPCDGMECNGICKELRSGLQYCSCDMGYVGPDCAGFDCRTDHTQLTGVNNSLCMNMGECSARDDHMGFECNCPSGYFGKYCEMEVCSFLNQPCSGQGTCVGDVHDGMMCQCNNFRGGLMCEESLVAANEDLTPCQRQRRLMQFVHAQIKGGNTPGWMAIPVKNLFQKMGEDEYSIPYCLDEGTVRDGEFYSECVYNATSGRKKECHCLNSQGGQNYWHYFGEDDCRVFSGTLYQVEEKVYLLDTDWSGALEDEESPEYLSIAQQIKDIMSPLNGYLSQLTFMQNFDCVAVHIVWSAETNSEIDNVVATLRRSTIMVNEMPKRLSTEPCKAFDEDHLLTAKFYIVGMSWAGLDRKTSEEYMALQRLVQSKMSGLGGSLYLMELAENNGCVEVYVEWGADTPNNILDVMADLKKNGITTAAGMTYNVQMKPCLPTAAEVDECPAVPSDTFGICVEACNDDEPAMRCAENFKCCSNGCGHVCVRVGYTLKMNATVHLDMPWLDGIDDKESELFKGVEGLAKQMIQDTLNTDSMMIVEDVELIGIRRYMFESKVTPMLHLVIYTSTDPANNQLMQVASALEGRSFFVSPVKLEAVVRHIDLGNRGAPCDGIKCNGICKELRSGLQYCSCDMGYVGPDCSGFDCRRDNSQLIAADNSLCMNGGECLVNNDDDGDRSLECHCMPGSFGDVCEYKLCDLLNNPCQNQGTCLGDVDMGKICQCNDYWGGITCEDRLTMPTEELSVCEEQRRLMLFVHHQVRGDESQPGWLSMPMKRILHMMGSEEYPVPFCLARYEGAEAEFYSMCTHNSTTGQKTRCFCVNSQGEYNAWDYFAEDDCRIYSGPRVEVKTGFYIHNTTWSDDLKDDESDLYMKIKEQIVSLMSGALGGYLSQLTFKQSFGCIAVNVEWMAPSSDISKLMEQMATSGLTIDGQHKRLSREPCKPEYDLNSCPYTEHNLPDGMLGLCAMTCNVSDDRACDGERKCCKNSCGGSACIEVGFLQKMRMNVTVDTSYENSLSDPTSAAYLLYKSELESAIHDVLTAYALQGFKSVKILGFAPTSTGNTKRRKRQLVMQKLTIMMELRFTEEIPVEQMYSIREDFLKNGVSMQNNNIDILNMTFSHDYCDQGYCAEGFCVTRLGETRQCACPKSRTGRLCDLRTCEVDGISLCQNGQCQPIEDGESICNCPRPLWGELCENGPPGCDETECLNGASCEEDFTGLGRCMCTKGYTGRNCETEISMSGGCDQMRCQNGASCMQDANGQAYCMCARNYTGRYCETKMPANDGPCEPRPCEDDPFSLCHRCSGNGNCSVVARNSTRYDDEAFVCHCKPGFSGPHCENNFEICNAIPAGICEDGCVGDVGSGYLCDCPHGYAGLFCDKQARTSCERRRALYNDALSILSGKMEMNGFDENMVQGLVSRIVSMEDGNAIPKFKCTETGAYEKVQCSVSVDDLDEEYCQCVDDNGNFISSNIKPAINYEVCTGTADFRETARSICSQPVDICLAGGECMFDLYNGKICDCPDGYYGQFCEKRGVDTDEPRSLCEFMRDMWELMRDIKKGQATWFTSNQQKQLVIDIARSFISMGMNDSVAIKAECDSDGLYMPSACYHDFETDTPVGCYCWGRNGPIMSRPVAVSGAGSYEECSQIQMQECNYLMKCPSLKCEFGHKTDIFHCPMCACRNPCETVRCASGHRCVVERMDEDECMDPKMGCEKAVCRPMEKPGACPGYDMALRGSIVGGGLGMRASSASTCEVSCLDDSDCKGEQKCCGLCGAQCTDPEVTSTCAEDRESMKTQLSILQKAQEELQTYRNLSRSNTRLLERIGDAEFIWIPECDSDGYLYKPLQCVYSLETVSDDNRKPESCFCVDRLGNRVKGSKADPSDSDACNTKPFSCPFLEPLEDHDDAPSCQDDLECIENEKCCSAGKMSVCARPVDETKLATTIDQILDDLCDEDSDMCQGGSTCVGMWHEQGMACRCPQDRMGPFCSLKSTADKPTTACERKQFAWDVFMREVTSQNMNMSKVGGIEELLYRAMERKAAKQGVEFNYEQREPLTVIMHRCTNSGDYAPKQCVFRFKETKDGLVSEMTHCFCVNEMGKEILGTRMPANDDGLPFCGGNELRSCPVGHAYHNNDGDLVHCEDQSCPDGYSCKRSTYGQLVCCPTKEGLRDTCSQPMDVGMKCPEDVENMDGSMEATRYFYDSESESCKSFTYRGCAGNKNNFKTMQSCNSRCKENIHAGTCPSSPVRITANDYCENACEDDGSCDDSYKCCETSCGKKCLPVEGDDSRPDICPVGNSREAIGGGACNRNKPCEEGLSCFSKSGNANAGGVCCPDVDTADLCTIPPPRIAPEESCGEVQGRFFFNSTSRMCEKFLYSGCKADFNNFKSLDECCGACNGQGRCKMGKCPAVRRGIAATCQSECSADRQCPGKKICCSNGCGTVCVVPEMETASDCLERQMEAKRTRNLRANDDDDCDLGHIPMCEKDGTWSKVQCQTALGICWCVSPHGYYIENTITRGVPQCGTDMQIRKAEETMKDISDADFSVCANGEDVHCCPEALCRKKCPAHPNAVCRINPCGGCKAQFYNENGMMVDCEEGLSECQLELKEAATAIQAHQLAAQMARGDMDMMDDAMDEYESLLEGEMTQRIISDKYPGQCQFPPETGHCRGFLPQWYFDSSRGKCDLFIWGMCGGNENRFSSAEECYATCDSASNPCNLVDCAPETPVCELQYDEMCYMNRSGCQVSAVCVEAYTAHQVMGIFVPRCLSSGEYSFKQCHGEYCWCVNSEGEYVDGLTRQQAGVLKCDQNGAVDSIISPTCPNGQDPNPSCMNECTGRTCPGQPNARCVADLCSLECDTKFVNMDGEEVECSDNECDVLTLEDTEDEYECAVTLPCNGAQVKTCPESVCEKARMQNCSLNPCALCKVDPCTCMPYFIDANTKERLSDAQCRYLSVGNCELKKCNLMKENEKARLRKIDLVNAEEDIPQCEADGRFKTKQCKGSKCSCVDEFGKEVAANENGSCGAIDKIKRVKVTFTFNIDYDKLKNEGKLNMFKSELMKKLRENGIDPKLIKSMGEPYKGSTKVDVTLEETDDSSTKDMTVVVNYIEQLASSNEMNLNLDGEEIPLASASKQTQTESEVAAEEEKKRQEDDDDGLDQTEIVIIAVVCGTVGLLIIGVIVYCLCCRKRKQQESVDDSFEHVRENKSSGYDKPAPIYNQAYEDDGSGYMKDEKYEPYTKPLPEFHNYAYEVPGNIIKVKL